MEDTSSEHPGYPADFLREAYVRRFSAEAAERLDTILTLRSVSQQVNNTLNAWLAGTAGSPARFQTLALLWAAGEQRVPHQDIIAALQVKRATVSALMLGLEKDGLVQSVGDTHDRRRQLASLTAKGREVVVEAMEVNRHRIEAAFAGLSSSELVLIRGLLLQVGNGFAPIKSAQTT